MEIPRQPMTEQSPSARVTNFLEVPLGGDPILLAIGGEAQQEYDVVVVWLEFAEPGGSKTGPGIFRGRYGYDLLDHLPELFLDLSQRIVILHHNSWSLNFR